MTDKRWKAVERGTAQELNRVLSDVGNFTPVERIPLLGREGPDLTVNESELVINVKSRQAIPARLFPHQGSMVKIGDLICFRLCDLVRLTKIPLCAETDPLKQLQDWYDLMDKWTQEFQPNGISTIILHRPRMPYGNCGVVIHSNNLRRLSCNLQTNRSC